MSLAAVGVLSLSSLAFELLITRYFSIAHWSHLSFFAISVAMLGFGGGGTAHALAADRLRAAALRDEGGLFAGLSIAGGLSVIGSFLAVKSIPLDYLRLTLEGAQALYLFLTCLLLSMPFFVAGLASCAAYALMPARSGTVSFVSLAGSVAGALFPVVLLPFLGEGPAIAAAAAAAFLPAVAIPGRATRRIVAASCAAGLACMSLWPGSVLSVAPAPSKSLPQLLQAPGSFVTRSTASIRGRLDEVESPSLRFAPGLSLGYGETLPAQRAVFEDGDTMSVLYDLASPGSEGFARWTHPYAPYVLSGEGGDSLVIQRGGGLALPCALAGRARSIAVVIENPAVARLVSRQYGSPHLAVIADSPRSFTARAPRLFDTISIEDWGPSLPGLASLTEDGLLTTDSILAFLRMLTGRGVLAISRRIVLPPSDSLRIFGACLSVLAEAGARDPARHMAVIRSWDSCTILACRAPLGGRDLARLEEFAEARGFDLDYFPGITLGDSGRFNQYDRPVFTEGFLSLITDRGFARGYPLDIRPQDDDRPFPSRFIRPTHLAEFFSATGQRAFTLLLSGEVVASGTMLGALGVAILLLLPVFLPQRSTAARGRASFLLFAGAAGIGFMFVEMFVIDSMALVFPAPAVALTAGLAGLLVSSAFGGLVSERLSEAALRYLLWLMAVGLAACALLLPAVFRLAISLPLAPRVALCLFAAGMAGFPIGIPFPAALRILGREPRNRASAWALNGCASAGAAIAAALIAPAAGIRALLLLSAAAYAGAAAALAGSRVLHRGGAQNPSSSAEGP